MKTILGVRFKPAGKIYSFSPGSLDLAKGDHVIVETARGLEYGEVVIGPREVEESEITPPLRTVIRKATEQDRHQVEDNREQEKEAFRICEKKIAEHHLAMKLVDVEYTFDVNKIVFYFTADGRIDFRELVKDLASVFRTRIELRQIGVRDEAKIMGGIGCCGRPLCCATFLGDFEPVSIRMAKEQNLSLNPAKISGICGRLMCCLKYENECYLEGCEGCRAKKSFQPAPAAGSHVATAEGDGKVIATSAQRHNATILLDNGRTIVTNWEDVVVQDEEDEKETEVVASVTEELAESPESGEGLIAQVPAEGNSPEGRSSRPKRTSGHRSRRSPRRTDHTDKESGRGGRRDDRSRRFKAGRGQDAGASGEKQAKEHRPRRPRKLRPRREGSAPKNEEKHPKNGGGE